MNLILSQNSKLQLLYLACMQDPCQSSVFLQRKKNLKKSLRKKKFAFTKITRQALKMLSMYSQIHRNCPQRRTSFLVDEIQRRIPFLVDEIQRRTPFWLMKSRGAPLLGGCMLMNSRDRPPIQREGPPLGTISMDLAVLTFQIELN